MDFSEIIAGLYQEKETLERAIAALEELASARAGDHALVRRKRAGRKSMGPAERQEVSSRMKAYWAKRRNASR
jgi:hypothetical protein